MNALLASASVAVVLATGYHFVGEYKTGRHAVACGRLLSAAEGFAFMVKVGHSEYAGRLRHSTQKVVAAECVWSADR